MFFHGLLFFDDFTKVNFSVALYANKVISRCVIPNIDGQIIEPVVLPQALKILDNRSFSGGVIRDPESFTGFARPQSDLAEVCVDRNLRTTALPFTVMETVGISYSLLRRVGRLEPSPVF